MKTAAWKILAFIVSRRPVAHRLIWRAQRTPYFHLTGYMERYWLFNPYPGSSARAAQMASDRKRHRARWPWLPSIRIHHILRADNADHPHDHPWDARTIILEGGYFERRHAGAPRIMRCGDTAPIRHGDFHHIEHVSPGGVWTLFITWDYQGSWGFLVNGKQVPWRVYEAEYQRHGKVPAEARGWCPTCRTQRLAYVDADADGQEIDVTSEPCESGMVDCGPAVAWDSEGVGACERCARELGWKPTAERQEVGAP